MRGEIRWGNPGARQLRGNLYYWTSHGLHNCGNDVELRKENYDVMSGEVDAYLQIL